jgi:hypothetical protein
MAKNNESKDLELKKDAPLPVVMDFEDDAGAGLNNLTAQDFAIPFIGILQSLSPQVKPVKAGGLEGAKIGMIFNTVTKELIDGDEGIVVIPCAYQKKWIEWKPRSAGGGFVKQHDNEDIMASTTADAKNDNYLPNGNTVVPTANYFVIIIKNGLPETAVLSMTKTQITKAKKWNNIMSSIKKQGKTGIYTPPMYSHKYRLTTIEQEKSGFSWYGWEIANAGELTSADVALYNLAKKLNKEVEAGMLKAKPNSEEVLANDSLSEVM